MRTESVPANRTGRIHALLVGVLVLIAAIGVRADDLSSSTDSTSETYHPRWMSWVPNGVHLTELSIPGSHDTMSLHGGGLVETHSMSLSNQLRAGIRALDIRARHIEDVFAIHHGDVFQEAMFGDVLSACNQFLAANPTETILMFFGNDGVPDPENTTRTYEETFNWYRDSSGRGSRIWRGATNGSTNGSLSNTNPTLGEVRGKIVIITKGWDCTGCGLDSSYFLKQDDWDLDDGIYDMDDKWDAIRTQFETTDSGSNTRFYVNWLSGSSSSGRIWPIDVANGILTADGMNELTLGYLFGRQQTRTTGIVMTDFPGAALIDAIIAQNLRLATSPAQANSDFGYVFNNVSHSATQDGDDECLDHLTQMKNYLDFILPGQRWSVLVTSTPEAEDWGFTDSASALSATTELIHGYRHIAIAGPVFSGDVTSAELSAFLTTSRLRTLSGTPQFRANALQTMLESEFASTRWNVAVKKEPGGFGNWAFHLMPRLSFLSDWMSDDDDEYYYVVWTTTANNRPPIVPQIGPYTTGEGIPVIFDASASTDPDGDTLRFIWDYTGDTTYDAGPSTSPFFEATYFQETVRDNYVRAYDANSGASRWFTVTVTNVPPRLFLGADETLIRGQFLDRICAFSDPGRDTWTVQVNYGDGTVKIVPVKADKTFPLEHLYATEGTYQVVVTINDGTDTTQDSLMVRVEPPAGPPTFLSLMGPLGSLYEGSLISVTGRFYHASWVAGTALTFNWADGSPQETQSHGVVSEGDNYWRFTASHWYADDVLARITVVVPGAGTRQLTLPIFNVAPTVDMPPTNLGGYEGWQITRVLGLIDPGLDTWQIHINYGDGRQTLVTNTSHTFVFQNRYARPGHYDARITLTDDEGALTVVDIPVTVTNAIPYWASFGPHVDALAEGQVVNVSGLFTSSSIDDDVFDVTIDWGDGTPVEQLPSEVFNAQFRSVQASHRFDDNPASGVYIITAVVRDEEGFANVWSTPILVTNVAPYLKLRQKVSATDNLLSSYGAITDSGDDQWTVRVNYGDNSGWIMADMVGSTCLLEHQYPAPGLYTVTAEVRDDDGAVHTDTSWVLIGRPPLAITRVSVGKVHVFWPIHPAPFRLQSSSNGRFTGWANVPDAVTTQGGTNFVAIITEDKNVSYRLIYDW